MQRYFFTHDNLKFSYLDSGGDGKILIALHAHFMGLLKDEAQVIIMILQQYGVFRCPQRIKLQ